MRTPDPSARDSSCAVTRADARRPTDALRGPSPDRTPELTVDHARTLEGGSRFDDLVSSLDAIVWEADGDDYRMTFVSPRSMDIAGYQPGGG